MKAPPYTMSPPLSGARARDRSRGCCSSPTTSPASPASASSTARRCPLPIPRPQWQAAGWNPEKCFIGGNQCIEPPRRRVVDVSFSSHVSIFRTHVSVFLILPPHKSNRSHIYPSHFTPKFYLRPTPGWGYPSWQLARSQPAAFPHPSKFPINPQARLGRDGVGWLAVADPACNIFLRILDPSLTPPLGGSHRSAPPPRRLLRCSHSTDGHRPVGIRAIFPLPRQGRPDPAPSVGCRLNTKSTLKNSQRSSSVYFKKPLRQTLHADQEGNVRFYSPPGFQFTLFSCVSPKAHLNPEHENNTGLGR